MSVIKPIYNRRTGAIDRFALQPSAKKQKTGRELTNVQNKNKKGKDDNTPKRTSSLFAPTIALKGHEGHIFENTFSPDGELLASCSFDKLVFLWTVYGECENIAAMRGHQNAVLELCWSRDGDMIFTASADKTGAIFDVEYGVRIKRFRGHASFVNAICGARRGDPIVLTGSDDCTAMLWDTRVKKAIQTFEGDYQITAVSFSDDSIQMFSGGIEEEIKCWDIRKGKTVYTLKGHTDTVTGMSLSPDGSYLLSNGMDNTVRSWDIRPYVSDSRLVNTYTGHKHDFQQNLLRCRWSADGKRISAGSSDRFAYIWDVRTKRIMYKLPGHAGSVSDIDFHPIEPIISSCSADKVILLGEIEPTCRR